MEQKKTNTWHSSWNLVRGLIVGWSATIYLGMRKDVGKRHPGLYGVIGIVWMVLFGLHTHSQGLLWLAVITAVAMIGHTVSQSPKPSAVHTAYVGHPALAMMFFRLTDEAKAKRIGEPLISLIIGGIFMLLDQPGLAKYYGCGAGVLVINQRLTELFETHRVDDMRDGMIEGHSLMEKAKERSDVTGKVGRNVKGDRARGGEGFAQRNSPGIPTKPARRG